MKAHDRIRQWVADGRVVGVFENHDLGSRDIGRKIAMPFDAEDRGKLVVGQTKAPDTSIGLGWRYVLIEVCDEADAAIAHFIEPEVVPARTGHH